MLGDLTQGLRLLYLITILVLFGVVVFATGVGADQKTAILPCGLWGLVANTLTTEPPHQLHHIDF